MGLVRVDAHRLLDGPCSPEHALLALELPLRVQRWPTLAARVWTLAGVLLPAPLFVEPMLRLFATPALYV